MVPVPDKYTTDTFMVKINNVDVSKFITSYVINEYDITTSDTGMNDAGITQIEYVRKDKVKVSITWSDIDSTYLQLIRNAISNGTFSAEVVDGDYRQSITCDAYRGDRTITMKRNSVTNKPEWDFTFAIIEL